MKNLIGHNAGGAQDGVLFLRTPNKSTHPGGLIWLDNSLSAALERGYFASS